MNSLKKIIHTTYNILRSLSLRARLLIIFCLVLFCVGTFLFFNARATARFADDYAAYAALARAHESAAYVAGAPNNPVRQQLNQVLTDVLGKKMKADARLELATHGLTLVDDTEKQIHAITTAGDEVDIAIARMQINALNSFFSGQDTREVIVLAKKRAAIISDIRAYSYRASFEVKQIFDHIIAEKGALSDAYIIELNTTVPVLEEQFNKRSSLYTELQRTGQEMQQRFGSGGAQ